MKIGKLCTFLDVSDERLTGIKWKGIDDGLALKNFIKKTKFSTSMLESKVF